MKKDMEDKRWLNRQGRRKAIGCRELNEKDMMGNRNISQKQSYSEP